MSRNAALWALIVVGAGILLYMGFGMNMGVMAKNRMQMQNSASQGANPAGTFDSKHVGLHFDYPAGYSQALNHINEDQPDEYHQTVFVKGATTTDAQGSNLLPNITISGIDLDEPVGLAAWVKADPRSKLSLAGGEPAHTTVGGEPALTYAYAQDDYTHTVVAAEDQKRMFVFDVSYRNPTDQIKQDFDAIIKNLTFLAPPNAY